MPRLSGPAPRLRVAEADSACRAARRPRSYQPATGARLLGTWTSSTPSTSRSRPRRRWRRACGRARWREFVGQEHIVGPGTVLRAAIERGGALLDDLLRAAGHAARRRWRALIAAETGARFVQLSAVSAGTADVRAAIQGAREARALDAARTILFIDEIHRFNKAQQDALLPAIEDGVVYADRRDHREPLLRGQLGPALALPALPLRAAAAGAGRAGRARPRSTTRSAASAARRVHARATGGLAFLAEVAHGDARVALNALETAVRSRAAGARRRRWPCSRGRPARRRPEERRSSYDREDAHYDTISAFIKSHARQRPRRRRLLPGLDARRRRGPQVHRPPHDHLRQRGRRQRRPAGARRSPSRRSRAVEFVGMPECRINLSQAAIYLALAPKSNAAYKAVDAALADVRREGNAAAAAAPARRQLPRRQEARPRRGLQVPALVRRLGGAAVPARQARRPPLLRSSSRARDGDGAPARGAQAPPPARLTG